MITYCVGLAATFGILVLSSMLGIKAKIEGIAALMLLGPVAYGVGVIVIKVLP